MKASGDEESEMTKNIREYADDISVGAAHLYFNPMPSIMHKQGRYRMHVLLSFQICRHIFSNVFLFATQPSSCVVHIHHFLIHP